MRELLLLLCRYPFEGKNRETLSKLIGEVQDWHKLVELINAHGIIALAAYNIEEAGLVKMVPEDAMVILENGYRQSMVRNLWLAERWKEVNTILSNSGIKHVLLKGMALEHTLYGSRGLRQMTDNDILVKRDDAIKVWKLLQKEGFSLELMKSPWHRKIMIEIGKHLPCLYKNGYAIEIHHKLFGNNIDYDNTYGDPIDDSVEIVIGGTKAWILPKEIQLMHLLDHFKRHTLEGDCQLRLYTDIMLLDKSNFIQIPDSFLLNPIQENKPEYRKAAYKINIGSLPANKRFQYIIGDIFPSIEWMKNRYKCNRRMAIIYYPLRIGKLIWLI
jgi:hypothetical protein